MNQVQAAPDQLRQRPEGPMDTSIIPLLDVRSPASTALIVKEGPALARIRTVVVVITVILVNVAKKHNNQFL